MNDGLRVQQSNRRADLVHHNTRFELRDGRGGLFDVLAQMPVKRTLDDDVEVQQIVEEPVDFDDVGVTDVHLYLQFPDELLEHVVFSELAFGHYFDGAEHAALLLGG
jgi:hypothetical protein